MPHSARSVLPSIIAALLLYLAAVVITIGVHVPRNNAIKAVATPDSSTDFAAVRQQFDEAKWASWNVVRAVTSTAAFGCLAWALVLYGRA